MATVHQINHENVLKSRRGFGALDLHRKDRMGAAELSPSNLTLHSVHQPKGRQGGVMGVSDSDAALSEKK